MQTKTGTPVVELIKMWKTGLLCGYLLLLNVPSLHAQQIITTEQQQGIEEIATDRVKVFTKYLSLLAKEREGDNIEQYREYLALSLKEVDPELPFRVYNDLLPAAVLEKNPVLDRHVFLDEYLKQLEANYSYSLHLSFDNFRAQKIGFSEYLNQYYVIVTAQREIKGMYRVNTQLMENKAVSTIDFFVYLSLTPDAYYVGGIFGFEPHEERSRFTPIIFMEDAEQGKQKEAVSFREPITAKTSKKTVRLNRGELHHLQWTGGVKDDIIEVELIPLNTRKGKAFRYPPFRNLNAATLLVNKNVRPGVYKFRITNITTGRYTQTGFIKIKRKFLLFGSRTNGPDACRGFAFCAPYQRFLFDNRLTTFI